MQSDEPKGNVYAVVSLESSLTISIYDEGQNVTPDEFVEQYRAYFNLEPRRVTRFEEASPSGCRLFLADSEESDELHVAAIFVPNGVPEQAARRELMEIFRMRVSNFDLAACRAAEAIS